MNQQQSASRQQTLEQRRAAHAYKKVPEGNKEYGSLVSSLPAMIQRDGLGQTLAFLKAKGKGDNNTVHCKVYNTLSEWITQQFGIKEGSDLLGWLLEQSSDRYRQVATETQAYLIWLKRFAEARGLSSTKSNNEKDRSQ